MRRLLKVKISGIVQGVGFRYFTMTLAGKLKLDGWVRNNYNDETVESEVQGEEEALKLFLKELYAGPRFSRVDRIDEVWESVSGNYSEFRIL